MHAVFGYTQGVAFRTLRLSLSGDPATLTVDLPDGRVPAHAILPVLQQLADLISAHAERRAERQGKTISCRKGCGACCRLLVPISEPEARRLAAVVDALPPERRTATRARFAEAKARLAEAGALAGAEDATAGDPVDLDAVGRAWLAAGVACPFLEDEACSIHPERPLVCREVSVASDPRWCATPWVPEMDTIPVAGRPSRALIAVARDATARGWLPLLLALDFAATADDPPADRTADEWLDLVLAGLTAPPPL